MTGYPPPEAVMFSATRMLLASDGSTTLLLEAMLDTLLQVSVQEHSSISTGEIDPRITRALGCLGTEKLILRRSWLVKSDGEPVSANRVIFRTGPTAWSGDRADPTPLGHQLRLRGALQQRVILSTGVEEWPSPSRSRCAYKEYTLRAGGDESLYVHERFNPRYTPLE